MIDNPLPDQVMEEKDALYVNEKYEEHCTDSAKFLAQEHNLHPDYYEPFIEFYIEECRESDRGYFFSDDKYIIDCWWDHNKNLYETKTPYLKKMSIKNKFTVKPIKRFETHDWFLNKHYAKRVPSITYSYGLYDTYKILQGVISFGSPASKPLVVGAFKGKYQEDFLELNRLCINDNLEKNVLSFFVSQSIKLLEKPKVIVSYADTSQGHNGYIYQATNWIYTGLSDVHREWRMYGSNIHSKNVCKQFTLEERRNNPDKFYVIDRPRKHRYFYLLGNKKERKEMKENLQYKIESYPKGENKRYDTSYTPIVQGLLF